MAFHSTWQFLVLQSVPSLFATFNLYVNYVISVMQIAAIGISNDWKSTMIGDHSLWAMEWQLCQEIQSYPYLHRIQSLQVLRECLWCYWNKIIIIRDATHIEWDTKQLTRKKLCSIQDRGSYTQYQFSVCHWPALEHRMDHSCHWCQLQQDFQLYKLQRKSKWEFDNLKWEM